MDDTPQTTWDYLRPLLGWLLLGGFFLLIYLMIRRAQKSDRRYQSTSHYNIPHP